MAQQSSALSAIDTDDSKSASGSIDSKGSSRITWSTTQSPSRLSSDDDDDEDESDNDEFDEEAPMPDDGCADDDWPRSLIKIEAWYNDYELGASLYKQLFLVETHGGVVLTPSLIPGDDYLLNLPPEIRNRVYKHYFDQYEQEMRTHRPAFRDREGAIVQTLFLGFGNEQLKDQLTSPLLQSCRQMRHEAMAVFFQNRVITVEWLPLLPKLVNFLGPKGCQLVRYLDVWDDMNLQGVENDKYQEVLTSIIRLPRLQHLRIVLSWGDPENMRSDSRTRAWVYDSEWSRNGKLKFWATPKMQLKDIDIVWPEHHLLHDIKTHKFTLATAPPWPTKGEGYIEFSSTVGAYPRISLAMQENTAKVANTVSVDVAQGSIIHEPVRPLENTPGPSNAAFDKQESSAMNSVELSSRSQMIPRSLAPGLPEHSSPAAVDTMFDIENSDNFQEIDTDSMKKLPIYNFIRELWDNYDGIRPYYTWLFSAFPIAPKSTGTMVQNCALCYLSKKHCGYHGIPDRSPYHWVGLIFEDGSAQGPAGVRKMKEQLVDISENDMRKVCDHVASWLDTLDLSQETNLKCLFGIEQILGVTAYLGWPAELVFVPRTRKTQLWVGEFWRGEYGESQPWDVLYRAVYERWVKDNHMRLF